jgi:hypothetical protein
MKLGLLFFLQLLCFTLYASKGTDEAFTLDSQLDEGLWAKTQHFSGFYQNFPADTALAHAPTEAWLLVAGDQLLIGAKMYNEGGKARAPRCGEIFHERQRSGGINGNVGYRFQPWLTSFLSYNYTRLQMPAPLADNEVFFGGLELRASLSRLLFANMQLQYNSLGESIGLYARLQWEFKPLSNLLLVYQDNYYESFSQLQRRNLSAKLLYWI